MSSPFRRLLVATLTSIVVCAVSACGARTPSLPVDTSPAAVHDLLAGQGGQDFLYLIATHDWEDGGVGAAKLFEWIGPDATAADPAVASRAGESAGAVAKFLSQRGNDLLDIRTGSFGTSHQTLGSLNPELLRSFTTALIPYLGAMVCDSRDTKGFGLLDAAGCEQSVQAAEPVFSVLNTDGPAAESLADAAYARMGRYVQSFADNDPPHSQNPFASGLGYAGRLLGLVTVGAEHSDITPPSLQDEVNEASYVTAKAMLAKGEGTFSSEFLDNGALMSPDEVRAKLGTNRLDEYNFGLTNYLTSVGVQQLIKDQLRGQYQLITGHQ